MGATVGDIDIGVVGLLPLGWKASGPSDRFSDSCILNMSSCIEERRRLGVPKLLALFDRPGLEGVDGEDEYGVVAVLGYGETTGNTVMIGDGRSGRRRCSLRIFWIRRPRCAVPNPVVPSPSPIAARVTSSSITVAASCKSKAEIGDLSICSLGVLAGIITVYSSTLSFRTIFGLLRPSLSDIFRRGVGIDSRPALSEMV